MLKSREKQKLLENGNVHKILFIKTQQEKIIIEAKKLSIKL